MECVHIKQQLNERSFCITQEIVLKYLKNFYLSNDKSGHQVQQIGAHVTSVIMSEDDLEKKGTRQNGNIGNQVLHMWIIAS